MYSGCLVYLDNAYIIPSKVYCETMPTMLDLLFANGKGALFPKQMLKYRILRYNFNEFTILKYA